MENTPPVLPASRTCGKSTASLVLGILSFLCFGPLTGIPAIILGHVAHARIKASQGALTGAGMAVAGFVMGYVNLAISFFVVPIYLAILVPAVHNALLQGRLTSVMNNGRNIYVAVYSMSSQDPEPGFWPESGSTNPDERTFASSTEYFA